MGCRPSRSTLGRVGDSSWEYNKNFIREHKEKKPKSKKTGRTGRRKAPIYNDFSSTSKTYTNLNSKSSRITVRLSTDGSTLEIEQYDIDLNACVDKYRGQAASSAAHAQERCPYQTGCATSGRDQALHRCHSAPQLSIAARNATGSREMCVQNKGPAKHRSKYPTLSKPKKSKSAIEKGLSMEANGWCERNHIYDVTTGVILNSTRDCQDRTNAVVNIHEMDNNTVCDSDMKVLDLESDHDTAKSDNRSPNHCDVDYSVLNKLCGSVSSGASVANNSHGNDTACRALGAIERCLCSKRVSSVNSCCGNGQTIQSEPSQVWDNPRIHKQHSDKLEICYLCDREGKSMECHANQNTTCASGGNLLHGASFPEISYSILPNFSDTVPRSQCCTALESVMQCNKMSSAVNSDPRTAGFEMEEGLTSDIDFCRRNLKLQQSGLTNGFKKRDVYSASVLLCSDPESIPQKNPSKMPSSSIYDNPALCVLGGHVNRRLERRQCDDTLARFNRSNSRENIVSIETTEELMGCAEGNNHGSGMSSDLVFLIKNSSQTHCRPEEESSEPHSLEQNGHKPEVTFTDQTRTCAKYVTSGEETDETNSPEFEDSLDESFGKRFDFSNCPYRVLIEKTRDNSGEGSGCYSESSGSDIDDEEFLDALESTYV